METASYLLRRTPSAPQNPPSPNLLILCSSRTGAPTMTNRTSVSLQSASVAVAISQLDFDPASDARWSGIVHRGLNWSEYEQSEHLPRWRTTIIIIGEERQAAQPHPDRARAQPTHHPPGLLRRPLLPHDIPQHATERGAPAEPGESIARVAGEFYSLRNQLVGSMQDVRRDPALRSNAMRILSLMRTLYDSLHEGTGSRCVAFLETG
jgi:hypothetical protein